MNSKDLIRGTKVSEAGERPPGGGRPPRPGGPRPSGGGKMGQGRPFSPEDTAEFEDMERQRHSMRPRGPFSPQEVSMLKDMLLLVVTELMGNDFDGKIARKMMKGEVPAPGELQHILDEVRRIPDLPESHQQLLMKVTDFVNRGGAPAEEAPPGGAAPPAPGAGGAPPEDDLPPP